MKTINVLLTGRIGSRLWPLSLKSRPKQCLYLVHGKSLFQQTVVRNKSLCNELLVVGNADNYELSRKHLADIEIAEYKEIIEATPRNTAASIAFAAFSAESDNILLVTPSDDLIEDLDLYL